MLMRFGHTASRQIFANNNLSAARRSLFVAGRACPSGARSYSSSGGYPTPPPPTPFTTRFTVTDEDRTNIRRIIGCCFWIGTMVWLTYDARKDARKSMSARYVFADASVKASSDKKSGPNGS